MTKKKSLKEIYSEYKSFNNLEISFIDYIALKRSSSAKISLFGKPIKRTDSFWFVHSLKELFVEEVYKFESKTDNPLIIDCGSNIGLSIIYFKKLYKEAKIIGFEPDINIFNLLKENLSQFEFNNVEVHQKAVWKDESPIYFLLNGNLGGHLTSEGMPNTLKIDTVRLKNLLNQPVDFLKVDIEGAEYEVLMDCRDVLKNVDNLFVEYHSFHQEDQMLGEILSLLKESGFKVYIKEAWENMKNPYIEKRGPYFDLQLNIFGYRR